jgi:hypothetical protein
VTGWGRIRGEVKTGGKIGLEGAERVVRRENNGF